MCDAACGWQGGNVEHSKVSDDLSGGGKGSSKTEDFFLSKEVQAQPLRKQNIGVHPVCVHRDSNFKKVTHDTVKNSGIVRMNGSMA